MVDVFGSIGHAIVTAVLPSLATVIAGMVTLLLKRLLAKQGIELTEKQEDRLKQIVVDRVHATEESARRAPEGTSSGEKKQQTMDATIAAANADPSIPNPSPAKVSELIDSTLSQMRANPGLPGLGRR